MANISLEAAIRTCKVDTAYSNKVQSDRFLNPSLMVCPVWNGVDTTGRQVCADSFYTKNAGCNSAEDRVMVENSVSRPQYMEYINLSANGIDGNIYGNTMPWNEVGQTNEELKAINNVTGNFGLQFGSNTEPGCNYYPYEQALSQEENAKKSQQAQMAQHQMAQHQMAQQQMDQHQMVAQQQQMAQPQMAQHQMAQHQMAQAKMAQAKMAQAKMAQAKMAAQQHQMAQPQMDQSQMARARLQNARAQRAQNMMPQRQTHLSHEQVNQNSPQGGGGMVENFRHMPAQRFAAHQQNFRQQGALNNAFIRNDFRQSAGNM